MKKLNKYLMIMISLALSFGCEAVLEEDISDDTVVTIAPIAAETVLGNTVTFQWEELEHADDYRLYVTEYTGFIVLDTLIQTRAFTYQLDEGDYRWKVRGENFAYQSKYSEIVDFTVAISQDLTDQTVLLKSPSDQIYFNNVSDLILTWEGISVAISYDLEIDKTTTATQTILQETGLTDVSYSPSNDLFTDDATYDWRIRALNDTSQTDYSQWTFYVDRIAPNQTQLLTPEDEVQLTSLNVDFSWEISADTGTVQSPVTFNLEIASDANFDTVIQIYSTDNTSQTHEFSANGTYYWRVKAIDQAGNTGPISETRTLIIN